MNSNYLNYKGHAFTGFLWSIYDGIINSINYENRELELSIINTNSITEYTSILMDKILFHDNLKLGFHLNRIGYRFFAGYIGPRYFLYDTANPQDICEDIISKVIPVPTPELIWQVYLLTNANKVLAEDNVFIGYYADLLRFYSAETLNTYLGQPDINEVIEPKVFLHDNYAKVECCWFEEYDTGPDESYLYEYCRGLYIDTCEYEIQNNTIRLINRTEQQLLKSWYVDETYIVYKTNEDEEDLPF